MTTLLRRFLLLQILLVWQGGFLFYTSFVVPAGTRLLGAVGQGAITAQVTEVLNALSVLGLAVVAWELNYSRDRDARRTAARWWCWAAALVCSVLLVFLHQLLSAFMDPTRTRVVVRPLFYPVHRVYLWAITVQWLACLVLAWLTLAAWRAEDARGS